MRTHLFSEDGKFYKANLHSHSVMSDGRLTPKEMRDAYRAKGYSILCVSDHEFLIDHSDLNLDDFLMLTGYELYIKSTLDKAQANIMKSVHLQLISKDPHNERMICVDPQYMGWAKKHVDVMQLPRVGEMCHRSYSPRCVNCIIRTAHENGFLVYYNHPSWSLEGKEVYLNYHDLDGMEIVNNAAFTVSCYPRDDAPDYENFLRAGNDMIVTGGDDNHNHYPFDDPLCDSFGAFTMIKAKALDYSSVIHALEIGDAYASMGPEIYDIYVEDNMVHVETSNVRDIYLLTSGRPYRRQKPIHVRAQRNDYVNYADFDIKPDDDFFRIELVDSEGKKAFSRAYRVSAFFSECGGIE